MRQQQHLKLFCFICYCIDNWKKPVQDNIYITTLLYLLFQLYIILIHKSGKNSIKLLKFNLIYDLNTNGGELVQLSGANCRGVNVLWGELSRGELTSTPKPLPYTSG